MINIKDYWSKAMYIFNQKQKLRLIGLAITLVFDTIFELLGVISIYPFIALVLSPEMVETNSAIHRLYVLCGEPDINIFFVIVALAIIGLYVIKNVYNGFAQYIRYGFVFNTKQEIGVRLMRDYMNEPYSFFLEKNSSVLMRGVGNDVSQFFDLVFNILYVISDGFMMVVFGIYLIITDWQLSLSVIAVMVVFIVVFVKWNKNRASYYGKKTQEYNGSMTQWLQQAFGGVKEIKLLQREDFFIRNYEQYCKQTNQMNQIFMFINNLPHLVLEAFCAGVVLLVIAIRVYNGADAVSFVPAMAVFAMTLFRLFPRVSRVNSSLNSVIFGYPYLQSVYDDLKMAEENKNRQNKLSDIGNNEKAFTFNKDVTLEDIHFAYPNAENEIISGVSFTINKGQAIGLIGPSGAGKSTLADCILGILELRKGCILCDGLDISHHSKEWCKKLGYIPQTIFLSDDTVRNNVAFGLNPEEVNDEKVWSALEQAQLADYVRSLSEGLDTRIGERGVRFSGGQRQRIGIARALYNNPEILVLDEATSALDNETEKAVMESIEHLLGHKTMIIIAHRITTIKNCDVIFKVENGNVQQITYEDLMKSAR